MQRRILPSLFLVLVGVFLHARIAEAEVETESRQNHQVAARFRAFYDSSEINPRFCGRNVDAFIQLLGRNGVLPADFRRVVIRGPNGYWHPAGMLIAVNSRFGSPEAPGVKRDFWDFHVVGLHAGKVYDFSFGSKPTVLPVRDYLRSMFIPKTPFMPFGHTFRVRGQGPFYGPQEAAGEVNVYTFEIQKVDAQARQTRLVVHPDLQSFLGNSF